ncbi:MAG: hypothetical protein II800_04545 [Lachnospiraceae bacterium]|jgi:hypothetical protein|nr:hypothetical protein [Lachnospiraceae bacterium]
METEHIYVNGEEQSIEEAIRTTEQYAYKLELPEKESMRLRLLTEELLGLLSGITSDDYTAMFWVSGDAAKTELHLVGNVRMTTKRREELLASSKSGKNEAAKGIIGKLRDMITTSVLSMDEAAAMGSLSTMDFYGAGMETFAANPGMVNWTLAGYRTYMEGQLIDLDQTDAFDNREPWDELERSIIANLADDVRVSIRKDDVEIVVVRSMK